MSMQEQDEEQDHGEKDKHKQDQDQEQSSVCFDEFSLFIRSKTNDLIYIITTDGLLDVLVSNEVLTYEQVSLINEKGSHADKVRELLGDITGKTLPAEKRKSF